MRSTALVDFKASLTHFATYWLVVFISAVGGGLWVSSQGSRSDEDFFWHLGWGGVAGIGALSLVTALAISLYVKPPARLAWRVAALVALALGAWFVGYLFVVPGSPPLQVSG